MNRSLTYTVLGTVLAATMAITARQITQRIAEDNLLMGVAGTEASACAQSMVGNAIHGAAYDEFPKCSTRAIILPNGIKATIAFDDNLRSTDGSGKYSLYEYIWGNDPRADHVTWPTDTAVRATATMEGRKQPIRAAASFDKPDAWSPATPDF